MKQESISLIIPCFNSSPYLKSLFSCLDNIKYNNYEVIFINDCSTDKTQEKLESYCHNRKNTKLITLKTNGGLSNARYVGLVSSECNYILFLDSDDQVDMGYVDCFNKACLDYPNADIYVNSMFVEKQGNVTITNSFDIYKPLVLSNEEALKLLVEDRFISSFFQNKLFKKAFLLENYQIIRQPFEDLSVMHEIFYKSNFVVAIDNPQYHYILHDNSLSTNLNNYKYGYMATKKRLEFLIQKNLKELVNSQSINYLKVCLQIFSIDYSFFKKDYSFAKFIYKNTKLKGVSFPLKIKLFLFFKIHFLYISIWKIKRLINK